MNFDLNEDEELLKALAERFVDDRYGLDRRRAYLASDHGFSRDNWQLLAELGLVGAPFDPEDGGGGLDATAVKLVFEALGKGLVVEPLIENIMVAGRLFARTASGALREEWLGAVVEGRRRLALAHLEPSGRDLLPWVETLAIANGATALLTGEKSCVPAAGGCDGYIVTARSAGTPTDGRGIGLFLVAADAPGLTLRSWRMADGSAAASLSLEAVAATPLDGGWEAVRAIAPLASLARSAEAIGVMQRMFDETVGYLRTREQFGAPLGSFQAIQHRMAAQYAALEQGRALVDLAIVSFGNDGFAAAVDGARAFIADASLTLGHEMIQFHGGMGVSDELSIGHGHKRLMMLSRWPESPGATLDRIAGIAA